MNLTYSAFQIEGDSWGVRNPEGRPVDLSHWLMPGEDTHTKEEAENMAANLNRAYGLV